MLTRLPAPDAVVVGALLAWWIFSPAFHDDGWVVARERTFSSSGGFASYYNAFGVHLPGDYWLEWLQHWLVESTSGLVFLRVPALLCLAATWVLARWILSRIVPTSTPHDRVVLWTLASAFLVGAFAWGMTLRPEPVTALLVTAVLACIIRFRERGMAAPLAALAILLPFALTGHHAAVVAFAPLLVASPSLVDWGRSHIAEASTIAASAFALFALLVFVDSDLEQRRADAETLASVTGASWRGEIQRYTSLEVFPFGTPLRRAFVALTLLTVLAFLLRRGRKTHPVLGIPAASLGLSLLLLIATPSKFPWHFGALIGVAAVALAAEIVRLRHESRSPIRSVARPLIAIGAAVLAVAWSWTPRTGWSTLDLRTLDWKPGIETWLPVATMATALPIVLLAAAAIGGFFRDRAALLRAPWRTAVWTVPIVAVPLLAFTFVVLAADAVRTDSWTLTRQNLGALRGDAGCGLADATLVPTAMSPYSQFPARRSESRALAIWTPPTPLAGLPRFSLGPGEREAVNSPWFRIGREERFGLYVAGTPRSSDRLGLEWGLVRQREVQTLGSDLVPTAFSAEAGASLPWRFVSAGELPPAARKANVVRVTLRSDAAPGAALAVTAPVRYTAKPLATLLDRGGSRPLVFPNLVTYVPCVELPRLGSGIVEVPSHIVIPADASSPVREPASSPFVGVLDLYELERLPLADSANPPDDVAVFRVDRQIPGAKEAPPMPATAGG
jgi:arabinosyltransferase C